MLVSYGKFQKLILDTQNIHTLYEYIDGVIKAPFDYSDLLRWEWIQCVSAFDKLIHDLVRTGMLEAFSGTRNQTAKFGGFPIDISTFNDMKSNPLEQALFFEKAITIKHSYLAFQEPKKVVDALAYIWDEKYKWEKISDLMGINKTTCINQLKNIIIRRNQIVHEGDYIDTLMQRQVIFSSDVVVIRDFISKLGESIYFCVKQ